MRKLFVAAVLLALAVAGRAQDTNVLSTEIENFEAQTNALIIRAFGAVGTASIGSGTLTIRSKESNDLTHGRKLYGISVELDVQTWPRQFVFVDEEELEPLANALDYLGRISYDVTKLPAFDAGFSTKCGLRFAAHSDRKGGGVRYYFQLRDEPRISLNTDQLAQLQSLIRQAGSAINGLK